MRTHSAVAVIALLLALLPGATTAQLAEPPVEATMPVVAQGAAQPASGGRTVNAVPYPGPAESAPQPSGTTWTTIVSEDFESGWPRTGWETVDGDFPDPAINGEYCWNDVNFQAFQGSFSAWPAAGCAHALNPAVSHYPRFANSWMVYGPFSLAGASAARVRFKLWQQINGSIVGGTIIGDRIIWAASTDNSRFEGFGSVGYTTLVEPPTATGWDDVIFDLANVPQLGNLTGQNQVWVAWVFQSDHVLTDNGPFIDNIVIERQGGAVGGRGFGISRSTTATSLTWTGGSQQTSYTLARVGLPSNTTAFFTVAGNLTSYMDTNPGGDQIYCYVLAAMSQNTPIGLSDSLCAMPNTRTGAAVAGQFTLRLNQSPTASFTWTAPGGQTGYLLAAVPLNGNPTRFVNVAGNAVTATDNTGGVPTCYVLVTMNGNTPTASTDVLCGIPGSSTLGAGAASSAVEALDRARSAIPTATPGRAGSGRRQ